MKNRLLLIASLLTVSASARAQQYAVVTNCSAAVDGGTATSTLTCPAVAVNFQPTVLQCEITTKGSHLAGTTALQVSADNVNYGPVQDGGIILYFNQDVNTTTTLSSPLYFGNGTGSISNPYQGSEIVTSIASNDGGTNGQAVVSCQTEVVQAQTIHAMRAAKKK